MTQAWQVDFHPEFSDEYDGLDEDVQDALLELIRLLEHAGPRLGRPHADTLRGSRYANMKELRFRVERVQWRVAYAFDPERKAILLVGGCKSGKPQGVFYKRLIQTADGRYAQHLGSLKKQ